MSSFKEPNVSSTSISLDDPSVVVFGFGNRGWDIGLFEIFRVNLFPTNPLTRLPNVWSANLVFCVELKP